jgi:hypothetical protein
MDDMLHVQFAEAVLVSDTVDGLHQLDAPLFLVANDGRTMTGCFYVTPARSYAMTGVA